MKMNITLQDGDVLEFQAEQKWGGKAMTIRVSYANHSDALDVDVYDESGACIDGAVVDLREIQSINKGE